MSDTVDLGVPFWVTAGFVIMLGFTGVLFVGGGEILVICRGICVRMLCIEFSRTIV